MGYLVDVWGFEIMSYIQEFTVSTIFPMSNRDLLRIQLPISPGLAAIAALLEIGSLDL